MTEMHRLLIRADSAMRKTVLADAAAKGLSMGQPKLLEYLYRHGSSDQKTIAAGSGIEPATAGTVLMRMETQGLIARERKSEDKRAIIVALTDKGRIAAKNAINIFNAADNKALKGIDAKDIAVASEVLEKICANLDCEKE